jgi:hypothetical protein
MRSLDIPSGATAEDPFGAIGTAPTNKPGAKSYPLLPDVAAKEMVDRLYDAQQRKKSAEATEKEIKAELGALAKRYWFRYCRGKAEDPPSSIEVKSENNRTTKVSIKNKYPSLPVGAPAAAELQAVFGGEVRMMSFMDVQTILAIKTDKIPQENIGAIGQIIVKLFNANAEELDDMLAVMSEFHPEGPGCPDAISRTSTYKPKDNFHAVRHRDLSTTQNRELEAVFPCEVAVGAVK